MAASSIDRQLQERMGDPRFHLVDASAPWLAQAKQNLTHYAPSGSNAESNFGFYPNPTSHLTSAVPCYAKLQSPYGCPHPPVSYHLRKMQVSLGRRVGAGDDTDVHLGDSKSISRKHARIQYNFEIGCFEIAILGANGLWINDEYCPRESHPIPLLHKTKIDIAEVCFYFLLPTIDPNNVVTTRVPISEDSQEDEQTSQLNGSNVKNSGPRSPAQHSRTKSPVKSSDGARLTMDKGPAGSQTSPNRNTSAAAAIPTVAQRAIKDVNKVRRRQTVGDGPYKKAKITFTSSRPPSSDALNARGTASTTGTSPVTWANRTRRKSVPPGSGTREDTDVGNGSIEGERDEMTIVAGSLDDVEDYGPVPMEAESAVNETNPRVSAAAAIPIASPSDNGDPPRRRNPLQIVPGRSVRQNPVMPFTVSELIYTSLSSVAGRRMTLQQLNDYIQNTYPKCNQEFPRWKNAIRYHLTLNPIFKLEPRPGNNSPEKGRGGFWAINEVQEQRWLVR